MTNLIGEILKEIFTSLFFPKLIEIQDLRPGEPRFMRRRSRQVVRYHKINRTKHPHEYYYSELQLYSKFVKEKELEPDDIDKCKRLFEKEASTIKNVKSVLMEHLESAEEGTERAQELMNSNIGDTLDPALAQENEDLAGMGFEEDPDFVFKDPPDFL